MPLEAVEAGMRAVGLTRGARVLEVGAGTGALTATLLQAGLDVTAVEPGAALRAQVTARAPSAQVVASTFEEYEPDAGFDALFSANAFHWIDPDVAYAKAAAVADALVLIWNTPFPADADLFRRVQEQVMVPRGSTFPADEAGVRAWVAGESAAGREELAASGRFDPPWWHVYERSLEYTPERYISLIRSMGTVAASGPEVRDELAAELRRVLATEPFTVTDLVYVVAARARAV